MNLKIKEISIVIIKLKWINFSK